MSSDGQANVQYLQVPNRENSPTQMNDYCGSFQNGTFKSIGQQLADRLAIEEITLKCKKCILLIC